MSAGDQTDTDRLQVQWHPTVGAGATLSPDGSTDQHAGSGSNTAENCRGGSGFHGLRVLAPPSAQPGMVPSIRQPMTYWTSSSSDQTEYMYHVPLA